jgi:transposase InsO family protein
MVVVDRLLKKKKFIPMDSIGADAVAALFLEHIWREEGYLLRVVSDRGTQFVSYFWRQLCKRVGTDPQLSTAFHPETDGQTEAANKGLKQFLRVYVNYMQDNWADFLPVAEFEANASTN